MPEMRALVLTDIVDSTRLSHEWGDAAMGALWAAHDRAARDLLLPWRGREIDKSDGMLLLFDSADDALGFALAYQHAVSHLVPAVRARAGVHLGPVTLRENSPSDVAAGAKPIEVEGLAKAVAARAMAVAQGGQVIATADAHRALTAPGLHGHSHGHWRLKGLEEPVELFEVRHAADGFVPPPDADKAYRVVRANGVWQPAREIRHSLPSEGDAFVGRAAGLSSLSRHLQEGARLVSLLGIGGTGKTRLATRFGRTWLGDFPGGVWFCDLAPARGLDGIASAVALGLDMPLGQEDPVQQISRAIDGRGTCLVILDNFEQVARHAVETLGVWLARASRARFLVTTREVLGLSGEVVMALPPLPVDEGAALLAERARAADAGFRPGAEDQAALTQLAALLEGLPLAIELAAARLRVMSPRMMLSRMSERFKLLASKGGRLDRQATLRAAFDWSWELLSPAERAVLAQLSVFEGGFRLEAAEAVAVVPEGDDAPWTVDVVQALVDKSFVRARGNGRFDLLVSVQLYAAEHLGAEGRFPGSGPAAAAAAQARHIDCFAGLGPLRATEERCADLDNLAAACARAVGCGLGDQAAAALEGAWAAWNLRGPFHAGVALAEQVCAMPGLAPAAAARARLALGGALVASGRPAAGGALYEQVRHEAAGAGDVQVLARASWLCGALRQEEGRIDDARHLYLQAIGYAPAAGDLQVRCLAIMGLGNLSVVAGRVGEAREHYESALALAGGTAERHIRGSLLGNLGKLHLEVGRLEEAHAKFDEALALAREVGNRRLEGNMLCNLGMLQLLLERPADSEASSRAALLVARELGHVRIESIVLCNLGIAVEARRQADEAQDHLEAAVRIARTVGDRILEGQFLGYLGLLHARQGRQGPARECLDAGEGLLRTAADAFGLAMLLSSRAECQWLAGDRTAAASTLAAAHTIATEVGAGPRSEIGQALARVGERLAGAPG